MLSPPNQRKQIPPALRIAFGLLGLYLVYCGLLFVFQRQMIFRRQMAMTLADLPQKFPNLERIWLQLPGMRVEAWCQLAGRRPSHAMILISPFISLTAFAPRYLVPPFLVKDPFDNLAVVRSYRPPLLIFHGTRDDLIPFRHGQALAEAAADGRLVSFENGHNDLPTGTPFWQAIDTFFREIDLFHD